VTTPIQIWRFADAPEELRRLSPHGGGEDWLAVIPAPLAESNIAWMNGPAFDAGCAPSRHVLVDDSVVVIACH
jgi:hypothetical protein